MAIPVRRLDDRRPPRRHEPGRPRLANLRLQWAPTAKEITTEFGRRLNTPKICLSQWGKGLLPESVITDGDTIIVRLLKPFTFEIQNTHKFALNLHLTETVGCAAGEVEAARMRATKQLIGVRK